MFSICQTANVLSFSCVLFKYGRFSCWISSTSEDWGVKKGTYLTNITRCDDVTGKDSLREMVLHMEWCTLSQKLPASWNPVYLKEAKGPILGNFIWSKTLILRGGYLLVAGRVSHWVFVKTLDIYRFITLQFNRFASFKHMVTRKFIDLQFVGNKSQGIDTRFPWIWPKE